MAEVITSPIQSSIRAIRSRFANSMFRPTSAPAQNAPVDPQLTRIIIRNTNAVNSVTVQLTSVAGQVNALTQSLTAISQSLSLSSQLEEQRMNAEANRQRQLATLGLREGKEGEIEKKIANAAIKPVEVLAKKASNILGALGTYFTSILFGWLGTKTIDLIRAYATNNKKKIREINNQILRGLTIGAVAIIGLNVGILAIASSLKGLAAKAIGITLKNVVKKPFISLVNLLRGGAGASMLKGGILGTKPPVAPLTKNLLPGKVGPLARAGNFLRRLTGGGAYGTLDAGIDILGGKNPIGAVTDSAGGVIGSRMGGKVVGAFTKNPWAKGIAMVASFMLGKNVTQSTRESLINGPSGGDPITAQENTGMTDKERYIAQQKIIAKAKGEVWEPKPGELEGLSNNITPNANDALQDKEGGNRGFLGWRSSLDWMTGGLTDFDKKGSNFNLFNDPGKRLTELKEADLSLNEPPPQIIQDGNPDSGSTNQASTTSGTGSMGGTVPRIPANNNDNTYIYSGYREYQIAPA